MPDWVLIYTAYGDNLFHVREPDWSHIQFAPKVFRCVDRSVWEEYETTRKSLASLDLAIRTAPYLSVSTRL